MSVLVTGGCGYIGSHIALHLIEKNINVIIIDNLSNSYRHILNRISSITGKNIKFYEVDLRNKTALESIFKSNNIESVMHLAASKSVPESTKFPEFYYSNNISSTLNLLEVMNKIGCHKLIFSSSCTVYGSGNGNPCSENDPLSYENPYGHSKLICEDILSQLVKSSSNWKIGVLRYFNPAGSHHSGLLGEEQIGAPGNLVPIIANVLLNDNLFLNIYGTDYQTKDGTGIRDYLHVEDVADAHLHSMEALKNIGSHTLNIGTGKGYSVLDVVKSFEKISGKSIPLRYMPRRPGDIAVAYANPDKSYELLGWRSKKNLDEICLSSLLWAKYLKIQKF